MEDPTQTLAEVLQRADEQLRAGRAALGATWPTGFDVLDDHLGGGLRSGELSLLAGPQGVGKTTWVLQVLRNVGVESPTVYFSFEHSPSDVLARLIAVEAAVAQGLDGPTLRQVRSAMQVDGDGTRSLDERLSAVPGGSGAVEAMRSYAAQLFLHCAGGGTTTVQTIREVIERVRLDTGRSPLVVVDYLQKVQVPDGQLSDDDRVRSIAEGLKDLALELDVPILAVAAADKDGLVSGRRLRVHHLRGAGSLAYEADLVMTFNDKFDVVARHHLVYDVANAERFHDWVVLSIEKNRSGDDRVTCEFRSRLDQGYFEPDGHAVVEQLVDERIFVD